MTPAVLAVTPAGGLLPLAAASVFPLGLRHRDREATDVEDSVVDLLVGVGHDLNHVVLDGKEEAGSHFRAMVVYPHLVTEIRSQQLRKGAGERLRGGALGRSAVGVGHAKLLRDALQMLQGVVEETTIRRLQGKVIIFDPEQYTILLIRAPSPQLDVLSHEALELLSTDHLYIPLYQSPSSSLYAVRCWNVQGN